MIHSLPQDAATSVWAAVVALADEVVGQYCENCHVGKMIPDDVTITAVSEGVRRYALDPKNAEALWKKREEMVGELLLKDDGMTVQVCGNARVTSKPETVQLETRTGDRGLFSQKSPGCCS
jgi:hypothetical protein